jgi:hypothetical protein
VGSTPAVTASSALLAANTGALTITGTGFDPVAAKNTVTLSSGSAIVLTDGYLESVPAATSAALRRAKVALHVGVVGGGPLHTGAPWLASSTPLPSPGY